MNEASHTEDVNITAAHQTQETPGGNVNTPRVGGFAVTPSWSDDTRTEGGTFTVGTDQYAPSQVGAATTMGENEDPSEALLVDDTEQEQMRRDPEKPPARSSCNKAGTCTR